MIPRPPPREGHAGFVYAPPIRVQGFSVAGEVTCVQIPEMDLCFDMGQCHRWALASPTCAVSHGHMDHIGGLAYYASQRRFQGMGDATIVCDKRIGPAVRRMMEGFHELERQKTPYTLVELEPEQEFKVKNGLFMKGFCTEHTAPSFGYVVSERRSKLKEQYAGLPQEKLRELKERGEEITRVIDVPRVAYLGDTLPGGHLVRPDVLNAHVVICECTFFEPEHYARAKIGMHMHARDIAEWSKVLSCQTLVLTHVSRRTDLGYAAQQLKELVAPEALERVVLLMDHRANRARFERQEAEEARREAAAGPKDRA